MAGVFSMQGVGSLLSVAVVLICLELGCSAAFSWRFSLAFGAVPAALAFPWRLRMHETESFLNVKKEREEAAAASQADVGANYGSTDTDRAGSSRSGSGNGRPAKESETMRAFRYYKWHMLGTASTWFLLDVVFYANGLFNHDVTALILSNGKSTTAIQDAWNSAFICLVAVPGYLLSVHYLEKVGRKNVQMMGFAAMGLLFLLCGMFRDWFLAPDAPFYRKILFLVLYSLTFLFSNFGPNTTTFVIPGEIYPAEVRATCHGISAACGKVGAATGAYFFPIVLSHSGNHGLKTSMYLCSVIAMLGALVTYLLTPKYSAEELSAGEDNYLALEHEWLRPNAQDLASWEAVRLQRSKSSQMLQVVEDVVDVVDADELTGHSHSHSHTISSKESNRVNESGTGASISSGTTQQAILESRSLVEAGGGREQDVEADVDEEGGLVVDRRFSYQKSFS